VASRPVGEILDSFRAALRARGIIPPAQIVADGRIHRCNVEGRGGRNDGTYKLYLDVFPAGGYNNWRDGIGWQSWSATPAQTLTFAERVQLTREWELERAKRAAEQQALRGEAALCASWVLKLSRPAPADYPYLVRKRVGVSGIRMYDGELIIRFATRKVACIRSNSFVKTAKSFTWSTDALRAVFMYFPPGGICDFVRVAR